jgi:uncharacterized protein (DUF885 family)
MNARLVPLAALLLGCSPSTETTTPDATSTLTAEREPSEAFEVSLASAATGVADETLSALLRDAWGRTLQDSPTWATRLGVHDWDDRLGDASLDAQRRRREARAALRTRAEAIDAAALSAADRETLELFAEGLSTDAARDVCRGAEWNDNVHSNPVSHAVKLHDGFALRTAQDGRNLVERYRAVPKYIDQRIDALQRGADDGLFASRRTLERLVALVDRQLAEPVETWAMLEPAAEPPQGWTADERRAFADDLRAVVIGEVEPAFVRYRTFVAQTLIPNARGNDAEGIVHLPVGKACYEAEIRHHTTLSLTADEVHRIGLAEIARIDAEITALGAKALGTRTLADTLQRLRTDETLYFTSEDEVEAAAQAALARAKAAAPEFFGILPKADCVVRRVPSFEAPQTHIGYYEPAHADGSKPGEYYVNVYAPATRPRFEARVLAVHESIPGHHLQIAIAQEREALPAFRRHAGYGAYVEGWALYTERLGEEMGLYETDLDRLGVLSFDAWRAGRLVVDTGIHAMGWTREEAEAFLLEHTALTQSNIVNEVDRYIGWPGQALGYKLGQRHILELRAKAEAALGEAFSLPAFHDVVLGGGPVTLPVLTRRVQAWIDAGGSLG